MATRQKYRSSLPHLIPHKDAAIIGKFLEQQFPSGEYKAADIVELARPRRSVLHKYFQWNDSLAAEAHRKRQASDLIRCIVVEIDDVEVRKYMSVRVKKARVYKKTEDIYQDEDLTQQLLDSALRDLIFFKNKYAQLKELKTVFRAVETIERKVKCQNGRQRSRKVKKKKR